MTSKKMQEIKTAMDLITGYVTRAEQKNASAMDRMMEIDRLMKETCVGPIIGKAINILGVDVNNLYDELEEIGKPIEIELDDGEIYFIENDAKTRSFVIYPKEDENTKEKDKPTCTNDLCAPKEHNREFATKTNKYLIAKISMEDLDDNFYLHEDGLKARIVHIAMLSIGSNTSDKMFLNHLSKRNFRTTLHNEVFELSLDKKENVILLHKIHKGVPMKSQEEKPKTCCSEAKKDGTKKDETKKDETKKEEVENNNVAKFNVKAFKIQLLKAQGNIKEVQSFMKNKEMLNAIIALMSHMSANIFSLHLKALEKPISFTYKNKQYLVKGEDNGDLSMEHITDLKTAVQHKPIHVRSNKQTNESTANSFRTKKEEDKLSLNDKLSNTKPKTTNKTDGQNDGGQNNFYAIPDSVKDLDDLSAYLDLNPFQFNILKTLWTNKGLRHTGTSREREANKLLHYAKKQHDLVFNKQ